MSGRHGADRVSHLFVSGDSVVHRVGAPAKLAGLFGFVVVVAATPRTSVVTLGCAGVLVTGASVLARLPPARVAARLATIIPFIAFAFVLPFIGSGDQVTIAGVSLSVDGLWALWGIVAKATIGATAGIVVTATTPLTELLDGLRRLRFPTVVVAIVAMMLRYLDLVVDQLSRTRRAMLARGHDPRWLWQVRPIASSIGALFVRTYERGERVHLAMLARGYTGEMPGARTGSPGPTVDAVTHPPKRPVPGIWAMVPAVVTAGALILSGTRV